MSVTIKLTANASKLARKGRPWFFADDLQSCDAADGQLTQVQNHQGRPLGLGFYSAQSKICLRLCGGWDAGTDLPSIGEFFDQRIKAAVVAREALRGPKSGARLVHSESDGLPGLVVDEYGSCLVLQSTATAIECNLDTIVPALVEHTGAECVVARNDVGVRRLEGLPSEVRLLEGRRAEEVEIEEHGIVHIVRPFVGHKTGFYLDQRIARARVKELARDCRVLDLFSYQGAFALAALAGGATSALAVDQSTDALELASRAAELNGLSGLDTQRDSAFDVLRNLRTAGEQFDLVVVDPPAFAKSRRELNGAERGYRDLNRHALRVLAPGGTLVTCSCSHHVSRSMFEDVLRQASAELPFRVFVRERIGAGADHPSWILLPESDYLKVCILQRGP